MKVEFKAVFSHTECQKFGEYVIKYCSPEYNKVLKRNIIAMAILTGIAIISGILSEIYVVAVTVAFAFIAFVALLVYNKNKTNKAKGNTLALFRKRTICLMV